MTDPYQILGISPSASDDEVKRAYKEMSRKYHPDSYINNPLSELAEEKFKEVQDAYTQIMDQRAAGGQGYQQGYQQGSQGYQQGGPGYQQGGQCPFNNSYNQYNRQSYQNYGQNYGRKPSNGSDCGTGNCCCDLWIADTLCECMGGDLCGCF